MTITPSTNDQLMALAAFRYCLGRSSYIVSACTEWLPTVWNQLDRGTQQTIVRDIIEALMDDRAGWLCDTLNWTKFGQWAWGQLDDKQEKWVEFSVAHKDKPWPLDGGEPEVGNP